MLAVELLGVGEQRIEIGGEGVIQAAFGQDLPLIFETIEAKFNWFPRTIESVTNISFTISSNIRLKFPPSFVEAPWFAALK